MKVDSTALFIIVLFLFGITLVLGVLYENYQDNFNCAETETQYFRYTGLFGGKLVETIQGNHDVTKEVCVKWGKE